MKNISFFGYGKTTKAIASLLGEGFDFYDDNSENSWIDEVGNRIHPSSEFNPQNSLMEILTPSIKPNNPLLKKAQNPISEYDLFLSKRIREESKDWKREHPLYIIKELFYSKPIPRTIWISGTNGKTTTTQMLTYLLKDYGAINGGNIGTPLANLNPDSPIWILETSSYTLHHTKEASPDIYLLLPITPDHLDWHGDAKNYTKDKLSPLLRMGEGEPAIIPTNLTPQSSSAWIITYNSPKELEEFFNIDSSKLRYKAGFLIDALLALATNKILFDDIPIDKINTFNLDRHRQEEIVDIFGRLWVNDSKATNIDATLQALEAYKEYPIHLIAGGDDKGVDMTPLIKRLSQIDAKLYAIGGNRQRLSKLAKEFDVPCKSYEELDEALINIEKELKANEVALLSPSASSLDQFKSYAERGDRFIEFIRSLRNI